jgi:uncharacterized protein YciI
VSRRRWLAAWSAAPVLGALLGGRAQAQAASAAPVPVPVPVPVPEGSAELPLFVAEIRTGPAWDPSRPPQDQPFFRDHSAHLRRLREAGHIRLGARYADKGLIVLAAATADEARAWMQADPSMQHGTFSFELHPFAVFYGGTVSPPRRRG